jgi:putative Holliday junction resolvase
MGEITRTVALDYGERRVGVAVSDSEVGMALAHGCVEGKSQGDILEAVVRVCRQLGADRVVVGKPLNMDGSEGHSARQAAVFAEALRARLGVPVHMWDERLSTVSAERALIDADLSRGRRKQVRDKMAARVILQSFLDSETGGPACPGGGE